jgi:hypothetical protein
MPLSANPAARAALLYITIGALMDVWAGIWFWYMHATQYEGRGWYVCTGVFLSGLVLMAIGLLTGRIGKEAKHADAPPATPAEAQNTANARAANVNAATTANLAGNAPTAGTPVYVIPSPVAAPGVAPAPGVTAVPATGTPAPGTPQHKV